VHDVLAFGGGAADEILRPRARRIFIAAAGLDIAAIVHARAYDVIHAVDAAAAHRIAPLVLGSSATPFVYSGRGLATADGPTFGRAADESLARAADLTVVAPAADGGDTTVELGPRVVRLDVRQAGLPAEGAAAATDAPPPAASVLREWLSCLARTAAA
jgi:hypothetical protein